MIHQINNNYDITAAVIIFDHTPDLGAHVLAYLYVEFGDGTDDLDGSEEGQPYLAFDGYLWFNQFFFDNQISNRFLLFLEGDVLAKIDRNFEVDKSQLSFPMKGFISYLPTAKLTAYAFTEWTPTMTKESFGFYFQSGLGLKYLLLPFLELEILYSTFWLGKNSGAGETYNFGIRYIH